MMKARVALFGGMGYPATETSWGMPRLKLRLEAVGAQVLLVGWDKRREAYDFMHGYQGKRLTAGDSLGAGSAGEYPEDWGGMTDLAAGFQPSEYDARTFRNGYNEFVQVISGRIRRAHCIYDPRWIDTAGLGYAHWQVKQASETKLLTTIHHGAHPDDWGYSQDLIFNEMVGIINGDSR